MLPESFHPVPKSPGGRVLANASDLSNLFECQAMPESENNDLTLLRRQSCQFIHGTGFSGMRLGGGLKPFMALQFSSETPPQAAPTIQCPVAKCPDKVMRRIPRRFTEGQKGGKDILNHVLRFGMAEPERPPIEHQAVRVGFENPFSPVNTSA